MRDDDRTYGLPSRVSRPCCTARSLCASSALVASSQPQDGRILSSRAGDGECVLLAAGQASAAFSQLGVEASRQRMMKSAACAARRGVDLRGVGFEPAVADVVARAGGEDRGLLRHQRDGFAQRGRIQRADVGAVDATVPESGSWKRSSSENTVLLPAPEGPPARRFRPAHAQVEVGERGWSGAAGSGR
jgi:hypothetical protein